jgi:hypothetical protein
MFNVILPKGTLGESNSDNTLDSLLRELAVLVSEDPEGEWASYGTNFENDTFMMHQFCWCEKHDCPWCQGCICDTVEECRDKCTRKEYAPNFHYKPLDFKVRWYKYIGRSMDTSDTLSENMLREIFEVCSDSLKAK